MSSVASAARAQGLFIRTPLIRSAPLSRIAGVDVYIKLDCLQPSGSFKDRGMAHMILSSESTSIMSSSGGNAGLAAATVAQTTQTPCTVIVPTTTKPMVVEKLESLGATVVVTGDNWNAADAVARERLGSATYVPPYEHPLLWTGHSTLVDEVCEQLPTTMATVILSVGGGGLLCGVLEGLERNGQTTTRVVAAETDGTASFAGAWAAQDVVRLDAITSVATSLGALQVSPSALARAQKYPGTVETCLCSDAEAVDACVQFAKDHRILVEPACGAALAVVYSKKVAFEKGPVVVQVCGGSGVNLDLLQQWKTDCGLV